MGERGVAVVCVCALALLLAACGSGGSSSETDAGLPRAAYVHQADAICKQAKNEIVNGNFGQIRKLADDPKAREDFEYEIVETAVIPALEHEVDQLEALGTPPGNAAQVEQMLKLVEGAIAEAKTEPETYVSGDDYRYGSEHFGKARRLALAYGIDNCPIY
jgi:hypothetical protein